jgi:hypothetical protein
MTIDDNMIEQVYSYAQMIYDGEITMNDAVEYLCEEYRWKAGSAKDYIHAYCQMKSGGEYQRTINGYATEYFLKNIYEDNGYDALQTALRAVELHLAYQNDIQPLNNIREIYERFRNIPR